MGDTQAATQVTNGTPPAGRPDVIALRSTRRAEMLAAMGPGGELADKPADAEPVKAAEPPAKPKLAPAKPALDDDDDDELDARPPHEDDEDDEPAGSTDPDTARRIASVKAQEKRSRDALAKERADFERERETFKRQQGDGDKELAEFRTLKARAKYDPAGVFRALGVSEDDFEALSKDLYAQSKAMAADPKNREAAARSAREREDRDRVGKLESELKTLREERESERAAATGRAQLDAYFGGAEKLATDEASPLLKRHIEKNPGAARQRLAEIAYELSQKTGNLPSEAKLLRIYEKRRRADLEEVGVDVDALLGRKADPKKISPQAADKDRSATTPIEPARPGRDGHREKRGGIVAALERELA